MKIKIKSEEELLAVTAQLIHVLANLRKFTILWEQTHGVVLKERKKYYEAKADELISTLQIEDHRRIEQINIIIEKQDKL